tara:strand:+ start:1171 stop:1434 length:264 start_codon:yes stop_codon:yes gene_type:complete
MQVSAQGLANIARGFRQYNGLLCDAHGNDCTLAALFEVHFYSGCAKEDALNVLERIAVTAALALQGCRLSWGAFQGSLSTLGLVNRR